MTDMHIAQEVRTEITGLLQQADCNNRAVLDRLLPLVYGQMKRIAANQLQSERPDHTLSATALVHEAYIKLVNQDRVSWQSRAHFFALASQAMRRILVSYARQRLAGKRGGGYAHVTLNEELVPGVVRAGQVIELDEALDKLKALNERQSKIVELRFFGGLSEEEVAEAVGVSIPTVKRDWRFAKAWLTRELKD
jgi:RNA polymerase sigma factor (TIGR02999 family)